MDREVNIGAIRALEKQIEDKEGDIIKLKRALEKQIEEGERDMIKLKRARNSLLNISTRVPAEILGDIFAWSVFREEDHSLHTVSHFNGVRKDSYNFLLVCRHWFEVASGTLELWNFWGNTLREWKNRHSHPGVTPLDLVLRKHPDDHDAIVDEPLQGTLRNRALQDTIRQIHLGGIDPNILQPIAPPILQLIISSLTPDGEGVRHSSIESIDLRTSDGTVLDVSNFFVRYSLPKLRTLFLHGALGIPPWDRLVPHTTLLTTLSLDINGPPPQTTSQLLSILASNPNLQELSMTRSVIPEDDDGSTFQVPMRNLRVLELAGELRPMFRLLDRLAFAGTLDRIFLSALDSTVEDVLQISGPYLRGYFQRDHRLQNRLAVDVSANAGGLSIYIDIAEERPSWTSHRRGSPPVEFGAVLAGITPPGVLDNLCLDLIASTPQELVSRLQLNTNSLPANRMEDLLIVMPNIETLYLSKVVLSKCFLQPKPDGPHTNTKLLPSLRYLDLGDVTLTDDGWGHLTTYLIHQTSGGQVISLHASGSSHMCPEAMSEVVGLVEEFSYHEHPKAESEGSPRSFGYLEGYEEDQEDYEDYEEHFEEDEQHYEEDEEHPEDYEEHLEDCEEHPEDYEENYEDYEEHYEDYEDYE
jgi:hypothetical protein